MKFVEEKHITNRLKNKLRVFAIPKIVRYSKIYNTERGSLQLPKAIYLPKELIGKRVKIRLEILEDE